VTCIGLGNVQLQGLQTSDLLSLATHSLFYFSLRPVSRIVCVRIALTPPLISKTIHFQHSAAMEKMSKSQIKKHHIVKYK
jgi:hypothetical protein